MITVALSTRVYRGELPYLHSFISHYEGIGIGTFYIIINDKSDAALIQYHDAFKDVNCKFIINDLNLTGKSSKFNSSENFDTVLPHVIEDYLLNVDADEFLDVSECGTIQEFIRQNPSPVYRFQWLIANDDGICDPQLAFEGITGKQMCLTDLIAGINCHDFKLSRKLERGSILTKYMLTHYWGRSFRDIMIKSVGQKNLRNAKNGSLEGLRKCRSPNDLPGRFKILATMSRIEKPIRVASLVNIDGEMENKIVCSQFGEGDEARIFELYQNYRESLDYEKHVALLADKKVGLLDYLRLDLCP